MTEFLSPAELDAMLDETARADILKLAASHQRQCLWMDRTHDTEHGWRPNIVTEHERGFTPCQWYLGQDYDTAMRAVDTINHRLGLTAEDARDIIISSMFHAEQDMPAPRRSFTFRLQTEVEGDLDLMDPFQRMAVTRAYTEYLRRQVLTLRLPNGGEVRIHFGVVTASS